MDTAPKASGCFLGGTQEIFGAVSEDLLGGTGKAEDAKLQGAGIIPKLCPMEREEMEAMYRNWAEPSNEYGSHSGKERRAEIASLSWPSSRLAFGIFRRLLI